MLVGVNFVQKSVCTQSESMSLSFRFHANAQRAAIWRNNNKTSRMIDVPIAVVDCWVIPWQSHHDLSWPHHKSVFCGKYIFLLGLIISFILMGYIFQIWQFVRCFSTFPSLLASSCVKQIHTNDSRTNNGFRTKQIDKYLRCKPYK